MLPTIRKQKKNKQYLCILINWMFMMVFFSSFIYLRFVESERRDSMQSKSHEQSHEVMDLSFCRINHFSNNDEQKNRSRFGCEIPIILFKWMLYNNCRCLFHQIVDIFFLVILSTLIKKNEGLKRVFLEFEMKAMTKTTIDIINFSSVQTERLKDWIYTRVQVMNFLSLIRLCNHNAIDADWIDI